MAEILSEQDTFFGSIAFRNKLVTREQLSEAVEKVQNTPGLPLGQAMVVLGFLSEEQVDSILNMQTHVRDRAANQQRPDPAPTPAAPPPPEPETPPPPPPEPEAVETPPSAPAPPTVQEPPVPAPQPEVPPVAVGDSARLENLTDYLAYAQQARASDLHISAEVKPFLRLCGRVQEIDCPPLSAAETERLLFAVLSKEQKRDLVENYSLEFCLDPPGMGRFRATIIKQRQGWDGIFHIIQGSIPKFEELGLPDSLQRLTEYQQGLVLVTGPGNCGKTTTLAALLDTINKSRRDHIITVERPVEYVHTPAMCQITQREVGVHTESFSMALRAALREDPDIIMVGELQDIETLSMAISASETGHLVLGTLHTTSAAGTVSSVVDAFPVSQQQQIRMMVSESLRGILSQLLVPRSDGKGVALAMEILFVTPAVGALIRDDKPFQIPSVMQTSRKIGMQRMDDALLQLAEDQVIDGEEAWRLATNKQAFARWSPEEPQHLM